MASTLLTLWKYQFPQPDPFPTRRSLTPFRLVPFRLVAIASIVLGAFAFWFALEASGMGIVVIGPMIGVGMLVVAGVCFYWLRKSNTREEKAVLRVVAKIASGLLVLAGLAAVAFLGMGGGGIYK